MWVETGGTFSSGGDKVYCHAGYCAPHPPPPPDPRAYPGQVCAYKKGHEWDPTHAGCLPATYWDLPPAVVAKKKQAGELTHLVLRPYSSKDEVWQRQHGDSEMAEAFALWDQLPPAATAAEARAQTEQVMALWGQGTGLPMAEALQATFGKDQGRSFYNLYAVRHGLEPIAPRALERASTWVRANVPGGWWGLGGFAAVLGWVALWPSGKGRENSQSQVEGA